MTTVPVEGQIDGRSRSSVRPFGFIETSEGETKEIYSRTTGAVVSRPAPESRSTGRIFTDAKDMPSLEQLLREHAVGLAILEKDRTVPLLIPLSAGALGALSAVGCVLFLGSVAGRVAINPYTAVSLALGAIVILLALIAAIRAP
jgi:hypothetical protein